MIDMIAGKGTRKPLISCGDCLAQTVTWSSNPGSAEFVKIELSTDGGATWLSMAEAAQAGQQEGDIDPLGTLVASTPSDDRQAVKPPAVTSTKCRVRITWLENSAVTNISNANFLLIRQKNFEAHPGPIAGQDLVCERSVRAQSCSLPLAANSCASWQRGNSIFR